MERQEFGQAEELEQLRETPLPQPLEVHFVLREEDLVEGMSAVLMVQRLVLWPGLLFVMLGLFMGLLGNWFMACFLVFFAVFFRHALVRSARTRYRKEPLLQEPMTWRFSADEVTVSHPRTDSRMDWSAYKRVVETPHLFMLFPQDNLYNPIPKRAFADEAEVERFRELVREQGLELKVVGQRQS